MKVPKMDFTYLTNKIKLDTGLAVLGREFKIEHLLSIDPEYSTELFITLINQTLDWIKDYFPWVLSVNKISTGGKYIFEDMLDEYIAENVTDEEFTMIPIDIYRIDTSLPKFSWEYKRPYLYGSIGGEVFYFTRPQVRYELTPDNKELVYSNSFIYGVEPDEEAHVLYLSHKFLSVIKNNRDLMDFPFDINYFKNIDTIMDSLQSKIDDILETRYTSLASRPTSTSNFNTFK